MNPIAFDPRTLRFGSVCDAKINPINTHKQTEVWSLDRQKAKQWAVERKPTNHHSSILQPKRGQRQ
jgi:hypothetical protein